MRVNRTLEFVIGGRHFDALIFGYWEGEQLMYAARTRSGFTPAVREQLEQRFHGLETSECPFANLPEARAGRGRTTHCCQEEKLPLAEAGAGGAV